MIYEPLKINKLRNNIQVLKKARVEVDTHVGQERLIDEPDLSKLHYLQVIISETFRLFPTELLLLPHISSDDCIIEGYNMPRDTILLVNAWAIHGSPKVWDDPTSFKPEWFEGGEVGHKLMPFGLGRRACLGAEVLKKTRVEVDTYVGQERLIDEPDFSKLHYLQAIIYETFRLFPAIPLLLLHISSDDCILEGFNAPRDTILLVNAWAIHRDPKVWDDPTSFKLERFEGGKVEWHKLMSFRLGRRTCPGVERVVGLALGLIQCFEWKKVSEETVDLTKRNGLTMPKVAIGSNVQIA
ncbi:hypothetical protein TEA_005800 [Camellia sinensis var. sinensis]|uniref:Uncharacterized protein n=1 Tax=Camellia sinensis var. sinensis TaxID=542762 RepID=A0A4S4EUT8_CAMSN|nr:hypothetical protein TEA_005800 [Camellia sinensis var. sinensis]